MDKTKKLLSKNSFDNIYDQTTNNNYNSDEENKKNKKINRSRNSKDPKESMIIINNNININTFVNNDLKKEKNMEAIRQKQMQSYNYNEEIENTRKIYRLNSENLNLKKEPSTSVRVSRLQDREQ